MNTEDLIARLADHAEPVRRLPPPRRRLLVWLAWVVPFFVAVVLIRGLRPDLAARLADPSYAVQHVAAALTALCAAWAALASSVPGYSRRWLLLPISPALVWLAGIGAGCLRDWVRVGPDSLLPALRPQCLDEIALISVLPLAALTVLVRRGAGLEPRVTGLLTALAASAAASAVLDLFHHAEAAIIVLVWHFGGITLLSLLFGVLGRRLFRLPSLRLS